MKELLDDFNRASGLKAHHVAISYPDLSIEFDGYDSAGHLFHIGSGPTGGNLPAHAARLGIFQKYRLLAKTNTGNYLMSDGTNMRDAIAAAKAKRDAAKQNMATAIGNFNTSIAAVEAAAKQLNDEAQDFQLGVAELTNGPPA